VKDNWLKTGDFYSEDQIEAVLGQLGIQIISETETVFQGLCPFHRNTNSPSFAVNKVNGTYICFNPACDVYGDLTKLVMSLNKVTIFGAKRLLDQFKSNDVSIVKQVENIFNKTNELPEFPSTTINRMADDLWESPGLNYMHNREFTDKTLAYFQIGYSKVNNSVAIPVHDWEGNSVGVIGRTIEGKGFKNSQLLPTRKTLFNIHRAKKTGERVIIVESAMDAMRLHQFGYPNAVATCGGFFTEYHKQLIDRYFNEVIIMTDDDDPNLHRDVKCRKCTNTCLGHNPGRALGLKIADSMKNKRIRWAATEYGVFYPNNAKDVGEMSEAEIHKAINSSITNIEYVLWRKDIPGLNLI